MHVLSTRQATDATLMLPSSYRIGSPGRYCQEPWKSTTPERHATPRQPTERAERSSVRRHTEPTSPRHHPPGSSDAHLISRTHSHSLGMRATTIRELGSRPPPMCLSAPVPHLTILYSSQSKVAVYASSPPRTYLHNHSQHLTCRARLYELGGSHQLH